MIKNLYCPLCSSEIKFSYVIPEQLFVIVDGAIARDDSWKGPDYDNPYFHFFCSNDKTHDLGDNEILDKWCEDIEDDFKEKDLSA